MRRCLGSGWRTRKIKKVVRKCSLHLSFLANPRFSFDSLRSLRKRLAHTKEDEEMLRKWPEQSAFFLRFSTLFHAFLRFPTVTQEAACAHLQKRKRCGWKVPEGHALGSVSLAFLCFDKLNTTQLLSVGQEAACAQT